MSYSIRIKRSAAKTLRRLGPDVRRRLVEAIDRLADEPLAGATLKGEFSGLRRLRVGDYRIVYEAVHGELIVLVVRVARRGRAYRESERPAPRQQGTHEPSTSVGCSSGFGSRSGEIRCRVAR